MKKLCLALTVVPFVWMHSATGEDAFLKALQEELHKRGDPWIAGLPAVPQEIREKWIKLGTTGIILPEHDIEAKESERAKELRLKTNPPSSWDWRNHNGYNWMTPVKNQGGCGSCWAFGICSSVEARIKILENKPDTNPDLCEQYLVSCEDCQDQDGCGGGCQGGFFYEPAQWMVDLGIPDEGCYPYTATNGNCADTCPDRTARARYAIKWGKTPADSLAYKYEIMNGPAACAIQMKSDMFYYQGGVYEPIMGEKLNHGVCLCGWSDASSAWLVKNSWGASQPYIWIAYGNEGGDIGPSYVTWIEPKPNAPYISIELVALENDNNGDHVLDPGETADILMTLKNAGALDASGVNATLTIDATDVWLTDSTANYDDILADSSATNTSDPFHVEASASALEGPRPAILHIEANSGAYTVDKNLYIWVGVERMHFADITSSNATLTTTDNSAVGFTDEDQTNGSGFVYPTGGIQTLCYGSMAFGNSASYLVDNWYIDGTQDEDWVPTPSPDGRLVWVSPPTRGDTMLHGQYIDQGISTPKNVICQHDAWGFLDPGYDDFVILSYRYTNHGTSTITGLYSALFCDFDIGNAAHNNANINESKYLAWVDSGSTFVGITLLDPLGLFKNASTIKNETYIYPNHGMTDADQYSFMNKTLYFGAQSNNDYSAVVSAGPFDLAPGASKIVAFAIVGGLSQSEAEAHADSARSAYEQIGIEGKKTMQANVTLHVVPNPTLNTVTIRFSLSTPSKVAIDIYDITGRLVKSLGQKKFNPGVHQLNWDVSGKNKVPTGVFFVKLKTQEKTLVKKVLIF